VTLHITEQLHAECGELWGTSSKLYRRIDELLREFADPHLEDIPTRLPFCVEMWDRSNQHIRWVVAVFPFGSFPRFCTFDCFLRLAMIASWRSHQGDKEARAH
jgi:hypothetical protein